MMSIDMKPCDTCGTFFMVGGYTVQVLDTQIGRAQIKVPFNIESDTCPSCRQAAQFLTGKLPERGYSIDVEV